MLIKNLFFHIWLNDSFSDFIEELSFCSQLGINKKIKIMLNKISIAIKIKIHLQPIYGNSI